MDTQGSYHNAAPHGSDGMPGSPHSIHRRNCCHPGDGAAPQYSHTSCSSHRGQVPILPGRLQIWDMAGAHSGTVSLKHPLLLMSAQRDVGNAMSQGKTKLDAPAAAFSAYSPRGFSSSLPASQIPLGTQPPLTPGKSALSADGAPALSLFLLKQEADASNMSSTPPHSVSEPSPAGRLWLQSAEACWNGGERGCLCRDPIQLWLGSLWRSPLPHRCLPLWIFITKERCTKISAQGYGSAQWTWEEGEAERAFLLVLSCLFFFFLPHS